MVSMGQLGVPLGALLTAPIAVALISAFGWKGMYIALGLVGIVWAIVWFKIFTDYPEDNPHVTKEELEEIRSTEELLESESAVNKSNEDTMVSFFQTSYLDF